MFLVSRFKFQEKGFTLIEVLVAIFILVMTTGVIFTLFHSMVLVVPEASSRLEAFYLAQEGIEIARNIRDTNFAKIVNAQEVNWLEGLTGCELGCEADWTSDALVDDDRFLQVVDGFYQYDGAGEPTKFKRKVAVDPDGNTQDAIKAEVAVEVSWTVRGRAHSVEVSTEIYNWLESE